MFASTRAFAIVLLLNCAAFEVGLSQESPTGGVVTTKRTLKTLLAGVSQALDDFTCSASGSMPVSCTDHAPSLTRIEEAIGRIEDTLASPSTASSPPSLSRIEEAMDRIEGKMDAPSAELPLINLIQQTINRVENKVNGLKTQISALQRRMDEIHLDGSTPCYAAGSCAEILRNNHSSPSGYYWVSNSTGHAHSVYCDMTRSCGGVTGGWMRVAYLDMTNRKQKCPSGLRQRIDSGVRTCAAYSNSPTCSSVIYPVNNIYYSNVCGKILGYHDNTMNGFNNAQSIEGRYVDGISLTHGRTPRHHIWTFAVNCNNRCPCGKPPPAVSNDFFCDVAPVHTIDLSNPLWDGIGCGSNTCCSNNNPPWFHKRLPQPTTDNIEMRVCRDSSRDNEDVLIETIEIYVQ